MLPVALLQQTLPVYPHCMLRAKVLKHVAEVMCGHMHRLPKAQAPSRAAAAQLHQPAKSAAQQQAPQQPAPQPQAAAQAPAGDALFAAFANSGPDEEFLPQRGGGGGGGWDDDFNF
jgi:hypothetical protein